MADPPHAAPYDGTLFAQQPIVQDSSSVYTEKTANNANRNSQPVREFLVKIDYVQKDKAVAILLHHRQLLTSILHALKDQITIYDKHNKPIDQSRINAITSLVLLREMVDINTRNGPQGVRHIIIMKFRTSLTLYDIRSTAGIDHKLKQMNAYMQEHAFQIDQWDIASVGWFQQLHPNHMSYPMIAAHIDKLMKAVLKTHFPPKTTIPPYKLSNCTPKFNEPGKEEMRTKAIQVICERKHTKILHKLIVKAFAKTPIYVPWNARRTDPSWYKNCLRAQHKYLRDTWTLQVSGVNRAEMFYFENKIIESQLVSSVHAHRDADTHGRWNLLLHKDNYNKARQVVEQLLANYENIIPNDSSVRSTWDHPRKVGSGFPTGEDISSEGDRTYASASIASLSSYLTTDDQDLQVTTTNSFFDLSTMVIDTTTQNPTPSYLSVTQNSIGTTSTANEIRLQAELDRLRAELQMLKSSIQTPVPAVTTTYSVPPTVSTDPATTTTPSTMSAKDLMDRQDQFEHQMNNKLEQILQALTSSSSALTTQSIYEQSLQASDASSPVKQPDTKRQDVKATPPTKNHPVADVTAHQHP